MYIKISDSWFAGQTCDGMITSGLREDDQNYKPEKLGPL